MDIHLIRHSRDACRQVPGSWFCNQRNLAGMNWPFIAGTPVVL
jgi:hypothetical protein